MSDITYPVPSRTEVAATLASYRELVDTNYVGRLLDVADVNLTAMGVQLCCAYGLEPRRVGLYPSARPYPDVTP